MSAEQVINKTQSPESADKKPLTPEILKVTTEAAKEKLGQNLKLVEDKLDQLVGLEAKATPDQLGEMLDLQSEVASIGNQVDVFGNTTEHNSRTQHIIKEAERDFNRLNRLGADFDNRDFFITHGVSKASVQQEIVNFYGSYLSRLEDVLGVDSADMNVNNELLDKLSVINNSLKESTSSEVSDNFIDSLFDPNLEDLSSYFHNLRHFVSLKKENEPEYEKVIKQFQNIWKEVLLTKDFEDFRRIFELAKELKLTDELVSKSILYLEEVARHNPSVFLYILKNSDLFDIDIGYFEFALNSLQRDEVLELLIKEPNNDYVLSTILNNFIIKHANDGEALDIYNLNYFLQSFDDKQKILKLLLPSNLNELIQYWYLGLLDIDDDNLKRFVDDLQNSPVSFDNLLQRKARLKEFLSYTSQSNTPRQEMYASIQYRLQWNNESLINLVTKISEITTFSMDEVIDLFSPFYSSYSYYVVDLLEKLAQKSAYEWNGYLTTLAHLIDKLSPKTLHLLETVINTDHENLMEVSKVVNLLSEHNVAQENYAKLVEVIIVLKPYRRVRFIQALNSLPESFLTNIDKEVLMSIVKSDKDSHTDDWSKLDLLISLSQKGPRITRCLNIFWANLEEVSLDQVEVATGLLEKMINSPSRDIEKMAPQLFPQMLAHPDPVQIFDEIEQIFIKNALPLVNKKALVFQILYKNDGNYDTGIKSPMIRSYKEHPKVVEYLTYVDLLRSSVESGSEDLINYIMTLQEGSEVIELKRKGHDLSDQQQIMFDRVMLKLQRLSGLLNSNIPQTPNEIARLIRVREGQSITDRVVELFLSPLGIDSVEALETFARESIKQASNRNKEVTEGTRAPAEVGDLVKSFKPEALEQIFQEGFVAREFLGAEADSDETPLDIDLLRIGEHSNLQEAMLTTRVYGSIAVIVKTKDRFLDTSKNNVVKLDRSKPELFLTGVIDKKDHVGIRSAMAITNVDAFVMHERDIASERRIMIECAKKGLYIPIYDNDQSLLFTPEKFDQMRFEFAGTKWSDVPQPVDPELFIAEDVSQEIREGLAEVERLKTKVNHSIQTFFESQGVKFSIGFNARDLTLAEIDDTGSTGRGTSLPNNFDFDLALRLGHEQMDLQAYQKQFNDQVVRSANPDSSIKEFDFRPDGSLMIRMYGVTEMFGHTFDKSFELDVHIQQKTAIPLYESHDAVADRLQSIADNPDYPPGTVEKVRLQILEAKKVLKAAGVYKKVEDGGLGGIGVENWILAKGQGSFKRAAESFLAAAIDSSGNVKNFEEFKSLYLVVDAGANVLAKFDHSPHDNFISKNMTLVGYKKMVAALQNYLEQNKLDSTSKIS